LNACEGIRVLEIADEFGVSGLCGQLFTQFGAETRFVEAPLGGTLRRTEPLTHDGGSYLFHLLHAGKSSVTIDVDCATDRERLLELIDWADVLLADSMGDNMLRTVCELKTFSEVWPGKILCISSLFGQKSRRSRWIGNELIAEAASALMSCTGYPERPPVSSGLPYVTHTAALCAFNGAMAALWERDRSGLGQTIDLAIVDCQIALLGNFMPSYFLSGRSPQRIGNRHTIAAPWNLYPTSDGSVMICTGTGGTGWWGKIVRVIDRLDLLEDRRYANEADRVRNVEEVDEIISDWTRTRTMKEVVERMTASAIPVSEISTVEAVLSDPHYTDLRAMMRPSKLSHGDPTRPLPVVGSPLGIYNESAPSLTEYDRSLAGNVVQHKSHGLTRSGPLANIRVLEFGSRTSGPLAGRFLADLGADVVKIEPRKGESLRMAGQQIGGSSYLFHINNAGKRSVVVEPIDPHGRELILKLASRTDVWIENLAPGSLAAMGLSYADLKAVNPQIIYCSVSGFGLKSNHGSKRALDSVVQAASGLMYMTGYEDHLPVKLGTSAIDLTSATAVVASVLAGLRKRMLNGQGGHIDLAMADIGVWMTQSVWPEILCQDKHPKRSGNRSPTHCPHGIFPTSNDTYVAIAVETDAQWQRLVQLLEKPELTNPHFATAGGRLLRVELIERILSVWTAGKDSEDVAELLQTHNIPAAPVRNLAEVALDSDVLDRGLIVSVQHPFAGSIRLLGSPLNLSRTPTTIAKSAPLLGEHTNEILVDWLGMSEEEIHKLSAANTIVQQTALQLSEPAKVQAAS